MRAAMPIILGLTLVFASPAFAAVVASCEILLDGEPLHEVGHLESAFAQTSFFSTNLLLRVGTQDGGSGEAQMRIVTDLLAKKEIPFTRVDGCSLEFTLVNEPELAELWGQLKLVVPLLMKMEVTRVPRPRSGFVFGPPPSDSYRLDAGVLAVLENRHVEFLAKVKDMTAGLTSKPRVFPIGKNREARDSLTLPAPSRERTASVVYRRDDRRLLELAPYDSGAGFTALRYLELFARIVGVFDLLSIPVERLPMMMIPETGKAAVVLGVAAPSGGRQATLAEVERFFVQDPKLKERIELLEAVTGVKLALDDFWIMPGGPAPRLDIWVKNVDRISAGFASAEVPRKTLQPGALTGEQLEAIRARLSNLRFVESAHGIAVADSEFELLKRRAFTIGIGAL